MPSLLKSILSLSFLFQLTGLPSLYAQSDSSAGYEEYEQQAYRESMEEAELPSSSPGQDADENITREPDEYNEAYANGPIFTEVSLPLPQQARQVSDADWKKLTADKAFRYEEEQPQPAPGANRPGWWSRFFLSIFEFMLSTGGKVVSVILVSLLLLFIIVRVIQMKGNILFARKDKKMGGENAEALADDDVPDNWEDAIQEAARSGNYRLALRHSYRYLLHLLGEKGLIAFQAAKTNYQYVYELAGTRLHKPFAQLTRDYEYAWYGGFEIAKDNFDQYYQTILSIKKALN